MRKVVYLRGGLGNQLFQVCKFLDLQKQLKNDEIYLDTKVGFLVDFKYKRKIEIKESIKNIQKCNKIFNIINLLILIIYKTLPSFLKMTSIVVVDDKNYLKRYDYSKSKYFAFIGYFLNYKYVESNLPVLYSLVSPYFLNERDQKYNKLYKDIKDATNSVALCIRFYEESNKPDSHARDGIKKTVEDYNRIIKKYEKELIEPVFFVFVQEENNFTKSLKFNSKVFFISHNAGYRGSWARLQAQAYCKHHIFNNSTFYFWGTMFSKFLNKNKKIKSMVYAADNFLYPEVYDPTWKTF